MNFDSIDSTQFEELIFDLLQGIGYEKLSWRKGTGMDASPSDQGRDIEGYFPRTEADGHRYEEHWFIECKHHKRGVSPEHLQSVLSWASAEQPDAVLIVASHALSNPAKNYIEKYSQTNLSKTKIRIWEHKDLERLLLGRPILLRKYGLSRSFPFLDGLHPAHLEYLRKPPINTLPYFLEILDSLEPQQRQDWFSFEYLCVINPGAKMPISGDQVLGELLLKPVSYHEFKKACGALQDKIADLFLIQAIIYSVLGRLSRAGDLSSQQEVEEQHCFSIQFFQEQIAKGNPDKADLEGCIRMSTEMLNNVEETLHKNHERYIEFCETVLPHLFRERIQFPEEIRKAISSKAI